MEDYLAIRQIEKESKDKESESKGRSLEESHSLSPIGAPPLPEGGALPPLPPPTSVDATPKGDHVPSSEDAAHQEE